MGTENEIIYPSIVFKLKDTYYAMSSKHVCAIQQMPRYEQFPDAPEHVIGIFTLREKVIPLLDLRHLFSLESLKQEYEEFKGMLETRKQDHIRWVQELNRTVREGERFTLATDPHKCAFGRWYDNYHSDNHMINFHLSKIDDPHKMLHHAAVEVEGCAKNCAECRRDECLKNILDRVQSEYMPHILQLLDDAKELFANVYHEMVIVLDDGQKSLGIVVDEVLEVETLSDVSSEEAVNQFHGESYVAEIKRSSKVDRMILMLNDEKLLELAKDIYL